MSRLPVRALLLAAALALAGHGASAAARRQADDGPIIRARPGIWYLVSCKDRRVSQSIARRYHARNLNLPVCAYEIRGMRAGRMAREMKRAHVLVSFERDAGRDTDQMPPAEDPLDALAGWRQQIVDPGLVPPPVTPDSPVVAIVDGRVDLTHPEFAGGQITTTRRGPRPSHSTAVTAIAGAPLNGVGIQGVWPGMRIVNVPFPRAALTCADSAEGIAQAILVEASVISLSYGSMTRCLIESAMIQLAIANGAIVVAAVGNEFEYGNPREYPAALPHVLTVGASGRNGRSAAFSGAGAWLDLVAPGVDVLTAVRLHDPEDPDGDGYAALSGTSFPTPMVAAAAAWVRAARPELSGQRVADVLRYSARDIAPRGWDSRTGWGLLNVGRALSAAAPPEDPSEPNDDILWISGRLLEVRSPTVGRDRRDTAFTARLDTYEDPVDVYRVFLPRGRVARVTVTPDKKSRHVAVTAYPSSAETIREPAQRTRASKAGRGQRLTLANRGRRNRTAFVAVKYGSRVVLDVSYRFRVHYARRSASAVPTASSTR